EGTPSTPSGVSVRRRSAHLLSTVLSRLSGLDVASRITVSTGASAGSGGTKTCTADHRFLIGCLAPTSLPQRAGRRYPRQQPGRRPIRLSSPVACACSAAPPAAPASGSRSPARPHG